MLDAPETLLVGLLAALVLISNRLGVPYPIASRSAASGSRWSPG